MDALKAPEGSRPMRRHLILGGAGFIGCALASHLVEAGHAVVIADRRSPARAWLERLGNRASYAEFDLGAVDWDMLVDGVDVVHHLAWSSIPSIADADPARDLAENVLPTVGLLEALRRRGAAAPRLVFASSGGTVYGPVRRSPTPEDHLLAPITAYGVSKVAVELYLSQYRAAYGLDCRVARLANPYGSGQDHSRGQGAVTAFVHRACAGLPIEIWGDGGVVRDYIEISDAAAGLAALATAELRPGQPRTYNIASGSGLSLNGVIHEIESLLGRPLVVKRTAGRPFDVPVNVLDISSAGKHLGWQPVLSFKDGLKKMMTALGCN
jgi:UDP-glucose 4-epimerase